MADNTAQQSQVDNAVAQGTAYEVIRQRLEAQAKTLNGLVKQLNTDRESEFGSTDMEVVGRARARTENNCVPRDIVRVGEYLLFGYNVFLGLKTKTGVADVFSLYKLVEIDGNLEIKPQELAGTFLDDDSFKQDFTELYAYYKESKLMQLQVSNSKLTAAFQIGKKVTDTRVFRWALKKDGTAKYIDNRGERDVLPPPQQDFEWLRAAREDQTHGKHPHVNILDTVFVDTVGGNLTLKVEDNTEDGLGIYNEKVSDPHQSLDDAEMLYAQVGSLILLKIRPYQEEDYRYLIYNQLTETVTRIDAIGAACVQLPEDHGLIFPGGYYLQNGETKSFGQVLDSVGEAELTFVRSIRSPNGEDVLYVFYEPQEGNWLLLAYNLINKSLQNPIDCHGYTFYDDGRAVLFTAESDEPTRVHPMQVWQTPFQSDEYASQQPTSQTQLGRIGNAELVRGISDLFSLSRSIREQSPTSAIYEELIAAAQRAFDAYYWLDQPEFEELKTTVHDIAQTAELVLDEFAKVKAIRQQANQALQKAELEQKQILNSITPTSWKTPLEFVGGLDALRKQRGHLLTIRELRYIDTARIDELDAELAETQESLSVETVKFIGQPAALEPYFQQINAAETALATLETVAELEPLNAELEALGDGLDLLNELLGTLKITDATERTRILESISEVYGKLNQLRAKARHKRKDMQSGEAVAEFGALVKLFDQSVTNAVGDAATPEECDDALSRLLLQLQELEAKFSDFDDFLADILSKREELYETLESKKQQLIQQRQRRAQTLADAADRILAGVQRRSKQFNESDELNTYFSSDPMIGKLREMVIELRGIDAAVRADDLEAKLKAAKDQALRGLRDKQDIFEDGGKLIKLGRHKFSVNKQPLDLTLIPRSQDGETSLAVHLTGTDFYETVHHAELDALQPYWDLERASESPDVYRAEFLASEILLAAEQNADDLSVEKLGELLADQEALLKFVREFAAPRYQEGYEKGIHDHDAAAILTALWPVYQAAGLLRYGPQARALAQLFWSYQANRVSQAGPTSQTSPRAEHHQPQQWRQWAQSAQALQEAFTSQDAYAALRHDLQFAISEFVSTADNGADFQAEFTGQVAAAADYLAQQLSASPLDFVTSQAAKDLADGMLKQAGSQKAMLEQALQSLQDSPADRWQLAMAWLTAYTQASEQTELQHYLPEAAAILLADVGRDVSTLHLDAEAQDLMGEHARIEGQTLLLRLDDFMQRLERHRQVVIPAYQRIIDLRQDLLKSERERLSLESFKARPLSSFVRNKLINDVYLPIIGDNLAKQMGAAGDAKRTDLMGLLLLISPPGYGKTTLMEYVANRLGLIFVKVNAPALGHSVTSIDPSTAPNAAARQELEKLNLAFEMGNNVMLYVDDIQHTHPEFLQKFIALCDGTRRIEGVWNGKPKTYDMRGKKFSVVMAGNPYTESGDMFQIPDMLANRADIYNLGDVLSGREKQFAMSYIENGLTSNPVLAPLATREMEDVYKIIRMAEGEDVASTDLKHDYSRAELEEIISVMQKLFAVRDVILAVNQGYIASAATAENYRTEPPFKLQGSYRNINKVGEKIASVMTDEELKKLIQDHYLGEAQTLTSGAEENLLKLKEITDSLTSEEAVRWEQIKEEFRLIQKTGGAGADAVTKIARQIPEVTESLQAIAKRELDLSGFGESLSAALSTPLQGIETAVTKQSEHQPDFSSIGSSIGTSLNTGIGALGEGLSGLEKAVTAGLKGSARSGWRKDLDRVADSLEALASKPEQKLDTNVLAAALAKPLQDVRDALQAGQAVNNNGGGLSPKAEELLAQLHEAIELRLVPSLLMALDDRLLTEEQRQKKLIDWNPFDR